MINLPNDFKKQMQDILNQEYPAFEKALNQEPPISIRLNNKINIEHNLENITHCYAGYYLKERPIFTLDPRFHAGAYYVQESSSMYLETVFNKYIKNDIIAIDLCAAPGGKSTHLASLLSQDSLLISNEAIPKRANILHENMTKWGNSNTIVTNNSAKDFGKLNAFADLLVCDMPCSGEGMFRKEQVAIDDWSVDAVLSCASRQKDIITDAWGCLKKNGILIYSTCTFNKHENEENIEWIADNLGAEILETKQFYFHTNNGEGLFMAALRKTDSAREIKIKKGNTKKTKFNLNLNDYLLNADKFFVIEKDYTIYAAPKLYQDLISIFIKELRLLKIGTCIGNIKGKDIILNTALALSKDLKVEMFKSYEVDIKTALVFLKNENINIENCPKGYVLIKYNNLPLGWVKNLGNRSNNLYPNEWRIRMNLPKQLCELPF